eukprot:2514138-Pyramimonas_sp.AAC.1
MEAGVEIHAEEIAARKRAADAAISDNKPVKRTAISSQGDYNSREEKAIFRCFSDKREWSRPNHAGAIKFVRKRGWSWRFTMWRRNILYIRGDQVVTALKADLADTSQTIFERLFSQVSQDPWIVHWTTCDRMATCRFDCTPPKLDQIPVGIFFQSYPDEMTKL